MRDRARVSLAAALQIAGRRTPFREVWWDPKGFFQGSYVILFACWWWIVGVPGYVVRAMWPSATTDEQIATWARTLISLTRALNELPSAPGEGSPRAAALRVRELLECNQFDPALVELESLGKARHAGSYFWRQLRRAAADMGLPDAEARFAARA